MQKEKEEKKEKKDQKTASQNIEVTQDNENNEIPENPAMEDNQTPQTAEPEKQAEQNESGGLAEQVKQLTAENQELKDNLLRKAADFENFRKRMNKEKMDAIRYSNQMLLLDLTDTIDNFERAMKSAEESKDFDAFYNGVVLIEKQLVSMLENKWGLKRFNSEGEVFDPERHQAIAVEDSNEHDKEIVLEDFQKGYLYHDRVLRPAKVKVCKPVAGNESENN